MGLAFLRRKKIEVKSEDLSNETRRERLIEETRQYFHSAIFFSKQAIGEAERKLKDELMQLSLKYSEGKMTMEEFQRLLIQKVEPLRTPYLFMRERPINPLWDGYYSY